MFVILTTKKVSYTVFKYVCDLAPYIILHARVYVIH
jgi:hypothetical protein